MKLSLDALKERAEATASNDLLASISGGTESACHECNGAGSTGVTPAEIVDGVKQVVGFYQFWFQAIKYATGNGW